MKNKESAVRKTALRQKAQLMSGSEIERTLVRLAHEILEKNGGVEGWDWSGSGVVESLSPSAWAR